MIRIVLSARRFVLPALVLLTLAACGSRQQPQTPTQTQRTVTVAAAADLQFAIEEAAHQFEAANPDTAVKVSYGSSGTFYAQLQNKAPFDVFLSADIEYPRRLAEQGLVVSGSEFIYAVGRLVIWVPKSSAIDVEKLKMDSLLDPSIRHISIANPEHAPYGKAAEAAMSSANIFSRVQNKLVFGENVGQALQFVSSGAAEIGIVAMSLAVAPAVRDQGRYWEIPLDAYPRMDQGGAVMKTAGDQAAAMRFRAFLTEPAGKALFKRFGFFLPQD